jgi:hypothetical protein
MKKIIATVALALLGCASVANASPITYNFSGVLATTINGSTSVTGTFTLDAATATLSNWSLTTPFGTFDTTDSSATVQESTATNPAGPVLGLTIQTPQDNLLWLRFLTTLAAFDGSNFYTGNITTADGSTVSQVYCGNGVGAVVDPACSGAVFGQTK